MSTAEDGPAPDRASSFARILDPRRHNEGGHARRGDGFFHPVGGDVSRETATRRWSRGRRRRCSPLELGRDGPAYRVGNSDLRPAVPTCRFAQRDEVRTCLLVATVRGSSLCVSRVRSTSSPSTSRTARTHESREVVRGERQVRAGAHRSARAAWTHARCCFSPARSGDWRLLKRTRSACQTPVETIARGRGGRVCARPHHGVTAGASSLGVTRAVGRRGEVTGLTREQRGIGVFTDAGASTAVRAALPAGRCRRLSTPDFAR